MNRETILSAIAAHANWKAKLCEALDEQRPVDVETVAREDCCTLGRWLLSEEAERAAAGASLDRCRRLHAQFHTAAGVAAEAVNARQAEAARALLGAGSDYEAASQALEMALISLHKAMAAA